MLKRILSEAPVLILTGSLVAVVGLYEYQLNEWEASSAQLARSVLRVAAAERLIGQNMETGTLARLDGSRHSPITKESDNLVWIVRPSQCVDCFADLGRWNRFALRNPGEAKVVLSGVTLSEAASIAGASGLRGHVMVDPDERLLSTLEVSLPSVKLAVDGTGTILLLDARHTHAACNWRIEEQFARLRGYPHQGEIRPTTDTLRVSLSR